MKNALKNPVFSKFSCAGTGHLHVPQCKRISDSSLLEMYFLSIVELYTHSVEDSNDDLINFDDDLHVRPHKHDVISSLAVGGRWITIQSNLQVLIGICI